LQLTTLQKLTHYIPSKHNVTCNVYVSCNFLLNNV